MNSVTNFWGWLFSGERRQATRYEPPNLLAHYWDGAAPFPHRIRDISSTGLYMLTEQRWYPGTLVMVSLQREDAPEIDPDRSILVNAKVIRSGHDGVALAFVMLEKHGSEGSQTFRANGVDRKGLQRFLKTLRADEGQALLEYVLLLPFVFLLIINLVNFSGFFFAWITVANAARAAADYAVLGGASAGSLSAASATQINALIAQDISSLPNGASLSVNICSKNNAAITTLAGTCISNFSDPEPTNFVVNSIDVTYTYQPFIPAGFSFPNLNIYATIPPTSIHRQAIMRVIQ